MTSLDYIRNMYTSDAEKKRKKERKKDIECTIDHILISKITFVFDFMMSMQKPRSMYVCFILGVQL